MRRRRAQALALGVMVAVGCLVTVPSAAAVAPVGAARAAETPPPEAVCRYRDPEIENQLLDAREAAAQTWPQERLQFAEAWPFSRGRGVTVAIVDSGVDADHEQLRGQVLPGWDVTSGSVRRGGMTDCYAHGTLVAGLVAAQPKRGIALVGVAPEAKIVPVRETWGLDANGQELPGSAQALLKAMRVAVRSGAQVMNVSITVADRELTDNQRQRFADVAQFAMNRDVLIVAATGNKDAYDQQNVATYPALLASSFRNVVAVSGIDESGEVDDDAITGPFVTLAAPDRGMPCLMAKGGLVPCQGTSFAAPFVSGVAALIRSRFPSASAAQVRARLEATADPPARDLPDPGLGYGLVNPLAAVTAVLPEASAVATRPRPPIPPASDPGAARRRVAMVVAGVGLALAVMLPVVSSTLRRGRRRGWRPGIHPEPSTAGLGVGQEAQ